MEALLAGDYDDDDDDDDSSFDGDKEEEEDDGEEDEAAGTAVEAIGRWPLHTLACGGRVESLTAALAEGASTGKITVGAHPDGTLRTVPFDLNESNVHTETALHATILAAAEALALAAAPPNDPWARAAARDAAHLLSSPVESPLASAGSAPAPVDADAEARLACLGLLLEAGADPERKIYGRSTLHLACACAALPALGAFAARAVQTLVAHGASLTQVDACGKTPLHCIASGIKPAPSSAPSSLIRAARADGSHGRLPARQTLRWASAPRPSTRSSPIHLPRRRRPCPTRRAPRPCTTPSGAAANARRPRAG